MEGIKGERGGEGGGGGMYRQKVMQDVERRLHLDSHHQDYHNC